MSKIARLLCGGSACWVPLLFWSCNSTSKNQATQEVQKTVVQAKAAGHEIKQDAQELNRRLSASIQPDTVSPAEKLRQAEAKAKEVASSAGIDIDRATLLANVKARIVSKVGVSTLSNVNVDLRGSVVLLSGSVATPDQSKAAEAAAAQVNGVTKVENRLTVQP